MKNQYPQGRSGGFFNTLGFFVAIIFGIGLLNKAGFHIGLPGSSPAGRQESSLLPASIPSGGEAETIVLDPVSNAPGARRSYPATDAAAGRDDRTLSSSSSRRSTNLEEWIDRFSAVAMCEAVRQGVPAGISLAVGIARLENGSAINSVADFIEQVIKPLAGVKDQSPQDRLQSYFKYSANSERWAEGLGRAGQYPESTLKKSLRRYGLEFYDREVRNQLMGGAVIDPETERKAGIVAEEVTSSIRERRQSAPGKQVDTYSAPRKTDKVSEWENQYDEIVGKEVAKEIARRKLKARDYISEDDMAELVEETNVETENAIGNKLSFPGRKINRNHPDAVKLLDITDPRNAQAREELYQQKLREQGAGKNKKQ